MTLPPCTCPTGITAADLRQRAACPQTSQWDREDMIATAEMWEARDERRDGAEVAS